MDGLTVIFPFFENVGMLQEQLYVFNNYSSEVKSKLQLIVVDDASPIGKRADEFFKKEDAQGFDFQLYRILTKVRWNWLQCRNMGAKFANSDWLLLTDIDHVIHTVAMEKLMGLELDHRCYYTFPRINWHDNSPYKPHPNSYLMRRKMYWKVGGYDETFAGHYGTDGMYRARLDAETAGKHVMLSDIPIARVDRKAIPDASTTTLDRKDNRDPNALSDLREFKKTAEWGIQTLRQPYKRIF